MTKMPSMKFVKGKREKIELLVHFKFETKEERKEKGETKRKITKYMG